jgi:predicted nucleic acid-binding protein
MITRILDTSVACAWYLPEIFASAARVWQQKLLAGEVRLLVPTLHALEFGNVMRTYVRRGEMAENLAREIYAVHLSAPLVWEQTMRAELLDLAIKYETTTYDASYISMALHHKAPLLTAEKTTTPWVVKLGKLVDVIRP